MKMQELKDKNINELRKRLSEKQEKLRKLRFDMASKQVKNTKDIRNNKKEVARILTLINEKYGKE